MTEALSGPKTASGTAKWTSGDPFTGLLTRGGRVSLLPLCFPDLTLRRELGRPLRRLSVSSGMFSGLTLCVADASPCSLRLPYLKIGFKGSICKMNERPAVGELLRERDIAPPPQRRKSPTAGRGSDQSKTPGVRDFPQWCLLYTAAADAVR